MKHFVGIDLGTTNSAICSYDGKDTRIWKSPEQNDVTPSAIYIDRRGNKYVGKRAYDSAPNSPDNSALLFKRLMGTSTPVHFVALNLTKTPEECSAEVLKVLFGYLPEEIRKDPERGTVITVPAAFNQMQKDATMQAANLAGLGKVALMQEPVAAVMSVMKSRDTDGIFLIFDLGGGTLDIAIAESIHGRVNLLAHGGIAMCGGRDFDRALLDNVVRPWLMKNFDLPQDLTVNAQYRSLLRLAAWATEKAKIELSAKEEAIISLSENEIRMRDLSGNEIYLDIPLQREEYDTLIEGRVNEAINAARETLSKAGLSPSDLEKIVFVGGPTNYKPLRDKVAFELGVEANTDVNPMTAVAEGASLFAESIDWASESRSRKNTRGQLNTSGGLDLTLNYIARTPDTRTKLAFKLGKVVRGYEAQVDSLETGWTSGRLELSNGASIYLPLSKLGDNSFKLFVFDERGNPVKLEQDVLVITRTAATVEAIPASHSVGVEVLNKLGGRSELEYLVRAGESLPKKGKKIFKAAESLKAGSANSLNISLWEGEIEDPISDNRPIGVLKISGTDFDSGVIPAGADLECDYEILDSGNIVLEVSVPSIAGTFSSGKNFYSRQEGQMDFSDAVGTVKHEATQTLTRLNEIEEVVDDPRLDTARERLEKATDLEDGEVDTEKTQEAMENVYEARRLLAKVRAEHLKEIRQLDLDNAVSFFNDQVRKHASLAEEQNFDNLTNTAQRSIDYGSKDFETQLSALSVISTNVLWRQDWFIIDYFQWLRAVPHKFMDKAHYTQLIQQGESCLRNDDIASLKNIVGQLLTIYVRDGNSDDLSVANILRG